jgi:hypothetical protein
MKRYEATKELYNNKLKPTPQPARERPTGTVRMEELFPDGRAWIHFVDPAKVDLRIKQGWTLLDKPVDPEPVEQPQKRGPGRPPKASE